jgi:RHS repeat-associated protein
VIRRRRQHQPHPLLSRGQADIGYTGQRLDTYIKLIQMGARWYDPSLSRFVSADTLVPNPNNPQSLNRYSYVNNRPINFADPSGHCPKGDKLCEIIVKNVKDTFGVILQDDTAIWQGWEARLMEDMFFDIANVFARAGNVTRDQAIAHISRLWDGVTINRMHSTNNPFGGQIAWTDPRYRGGRIEIPDAGGNNGLWNPKDLQWTKHIVAEELGHSWDLRQAGIRHLNGFDGGPLSAGLIHAVHADVGGACFTFLFCLGYSPGPEPTVDGFSFNPLTGSGHAAMSPVEDWGGSFAQFVEPTSGRQPLSPLRRQYVRNQMALSINRQ